MGSGLRIALALLAGPLVLAGCSGTPFGDQLSGSFSAPQPASKAPAAATPAVPAVPAKPLPTAKPVVQAKPTVQPPTTPPAVKPTTQPSTPSPYRVTIKLPAADPAAPAEVVTEALRAAGVAFEVETIERIPTGPDPSPAPLRTPAPAPR
jgi:hypothetical protein